MFKKIAMISIAATLMLSCTGNRTNSSDDNAKDGDNEEVAAANKAVLTDAKSEELFLFIGTYTSDEGSKGYMCTVSIPIQAAQTL